MSVIAKLTDRYPRRIGWALGLSLAIAGNAVIYLVTKPVHDLPIGPPRALGFPLVFLKHGGYLHEPSFYTAAFVVDVAWALGLGLACALFLTRRAYLLRSARAGDPLQRHAPIGLHGEPR